MNLRDTGWHHVAFTWDADIEDSLVIYLDGVDITDPSYGKAPAGTAANGGAEAIIGAAETLALDWYGKLKHIRMYDRPLTMAEVQSNRLNYLNPVTSGLILWYPLKEGSGITTADQSGSGNNGSLLPNGNEPLWVGQSKYTQKTNMFKRM